MPPEMGATESFCSLSPACQRCYFRRGRSFTECHEPGNNVAEEGVLVGNKRRLELGLSLGEVLQSDGGHCVWFVVSRGFGDESFHTASVLRRWPAQNDQRSDRGMLREPGALNEVTYEYGSGITTNIMIVTVCC